MSKEIIIVDDDPMVRMLVSEYLQALGYSAQVFTRGKECLDHLANSAALPNLLILDLQMPEMNGLEVLAQIRGDEKLKNLAVLMLSANVDQCESQTTVRADCYLGKPFQMQEFLAAVESTRRDQ